MLSHVRASVYTVLASLGAAYASILLFVQPQFVAASHIENQPRGDHFMWAELILSPIIETLIMMLVWKGVRLMGVHFLSTVVFVSVIGSLAFVAHGGYPGGVSPAAAFVVFSIAYVVVSRKHSELHGFFVISSAHVLCNLVFLMGRLVRDLG